MKRYLIAGAATLALTSGLVLAEEQPESLLPPGFDDPAPAPSPAPAPRPTAANPARPVQPAPSGGGAVVQPIPSAPSGPVVAGPVPSLPSGLPSLKELEEMDPAELDELLGLKPRYDIPPAARRSMERVGILAPDEGDADRLSGEATGGTGPGGTGGYETPAGLALGAYPAASGAGESS